MRLIAGLDPGAKGGFAFIDDMGGAQAWPLPETERDIFDLIAEFAPNITRCFIEEVHAMPPHMPGNTSVASFAFGKSYGLVRGFLIALKIPFEEVSPMRWKKAMGVQMSGGATKTEKKNTSKRMAQQLWPNLKITHATSEALLLARYGTIMIGVER